LFGLLEEEDSLPNVPGKKFTTGSYLQKGASGQAVLEVQQALNVQGANPKVDEDGVFGNSTAKAITAYQQQNGLDVDGIAGPDTFAKLGITEV
jgi:peptidoglycan hydrolase-like protein with peptidoglycan-binding domain